MLHFTPVTQPESRYGSFSRPDGLGNKWDFILLAFVIEPYLTTLRALISEPALSAVLPQL